MAAKMDNVVVPIDLTAFSLSPGCCDGLSKIAPITQPNYIGLRLDESLIQHDVQEHIDFHLTSPAARNPRLADWTNPPNLRESRLGVYLHWSLPRLYRTGSAQADSREKSSPDGQDDPAQPTFRKVPNRWLVVRHLRSQTPAGKIPAFQSWVVESDRVRKIQDIPDDVDLEVDVSPFVKYEGDPKDSRIIENQAEIFIGNRKPHSGWAAGQPGWAEDPTPGAYKDLTIMDSSNPLFPDYVPHNGGVFSMIDSFVYLEDSNAGKVTKHLQTAEADYYVIGWHSSAGNDPLSVAGVSSLSSRLGTLLLKLDVDDKDADGEALRSVLALTDATRILLHGSVYQVQYKRDGVQASRADAAARKFTSDVKMEPLSVGTTPLDAMLTFLEAHRKDVEGIFGAGTGAVAGDLLDMANLLYAADDGYDARIRAQDMLMMNNFATHDGGSQWNFHQQAPAGQAAVAPTAGQVASLNDLNEAQGALDAAERRLKHLRWNLFAEWWKFVSDRSNAAANMKAEYVARVKKFKDDIQKYSAAVKDRSAKVASISAALPCKKSPRPSYFTRKEPALCIAGMDSGWPADFMDKVQIRLLRQLPKTINVNINGQSVVNFGDVNKAVFGSAVNPVPQGGSLQQSAISVLAECLTLTSALDRGQSSSVKYSKGFQAWGNANPFSPMFVEWEATYYHIDRTKWNVGLRPSPVGHPVQQVRYGVSEALHEDPANQRDKRLVSGRVLILPQPVFSLESVVLDVLDNSDQELKLTDKEKQDIKDNIRRLKFISCPLAGMTEHLLTRYAGTHVKPNVRTQGKKVVPIQAAVDAARDIGFDSETVKTMDSETAITPYGNLLSFSPENYPGVPFKGVTHGQLMFTKLNIVDKFGQAICLPEPKPRPKIPDQPPRSVHPCMSDYLSPDTMDGNLNTVFPEPTPTPGEWPLCRFMQLTPAINQNARVNAVFLNRNHAVKSNPVKVASSPNWGPFWHETVHDMPEDPVIGWIVVNYQDYGLQFFLSEGTFYREVRVGGPSGTNASSKWIPFDPPQDKRHVGNDQLDQLIGKLTDPADANATYVRAFFDMINGAIKTMPFPPSEYSGYLNSIVGKPLALVNVGWSLEIDIPALQAQNLFGNMPQNVQAELEQYQFPIKIGDAERPFDGVIGYFPTDNTETGKTDWDKLYTYFPSQEEGRTIAIDADNYPVLSPRYIDALPPYAASTTGGAGARPFANYSQARTAQYLITTMLIDPYTPLHAYSPILPITTLKLPPWSMQRAFSRMTAFFHLGPSLLSADVPARYDADAALLPDSWLTKQQLEAAQNGEAPVVKQDPPSIRLPISGRKGLWQWLQPYDVPGKEDEGGPNETRFNALDVVQEDGRIRKDPAPYTFVEGYLQLARPLLKDDIQLMDRN